MVELATSVMVLMLLLAACTDLGRMFYYTDIVWNAARAGVQYGMLNSANASDIPGIQSAALAEPGGTLAGLSASAIKYCACPGTGGTVTCGGTCYGGTTPGTFLRVSTAYTFSTLVRWPMVPPSIVLNGKAVMQVQ